MTSSLFSRAIVTTTGIGVQGLARFLYTLAIGRILGPEPLGDASSVLSLAVYFSLLWPAATGIAASRYLPLSSGSTAYLNELKRTFARSTVILTVLAFPLALWMTADGIVAGTASLLVMSYSAYVFVRGALLGQDRYIRATVLDALSSLLALTALTLVLLGQAEAFILVPLSVGYLLFAILGWPRGDRAQLPPSDQIALRRYLQDTTIGALATGGLLPATMIFVQLFDSDVAAGVFAAGLSLATPASLLSQSLNQVLIPHFSRKHDTDRSGLAADHLRIFVISALVFTLIFAMLIVLAPVLLRLLYGESYVAGTGAMQALLIVILLISCTSAPSAILMVTGHQRLFSRLWLGAFIGGTALMAILAPPFGITGALGGFAFGGGGGSLSVIIAALVTAHREQNTSVPTS